ncbi:hypothetical protein KAR91_17400 [Candidatus Pacearchaeota archaeon]|nr:hypothetical protein [Candidatus Pacearchaeota archaeon]
MKGIIELEDMAGDPCVLLVDKIYGIGTDEDGNTGVMLSPGDNFYIKTPYEVALQRLKEAM